METIKDELLEIVNNAIEKFNSNEQYLISNDLSERCICAKFAMYLQSEINISNYSDYVVDVEYNRGHNRNEAMAKFLEGRIIVVDLIVHKRGFDATSGFNNLICIEMKKEYKRPDLTSDKDRLEKLTDTVHGFNYELGLMILAFADKQNNTYGLYIESKYNNGYPF